MRSRRHRCRHTDPPMILPATPRRPALRADLRKFFLLDYKFFLLDLLDPRHGRSPRPRHNTGNMVYAIEEIARHGHDIHRRSPFQSDKRLPPVDNVSARKNPPSLQVHPISHTLEARLWQSLRDRSVFSRHIEPAGPEVSRS